MGFSKSPRNHLSNNGANMITLGTRLCARFGIELTHNAGDVDILNQRRVDRLQSSDPVVQGLGFRV